MHSLFAFETWCFEGKQNKMLQRSGTNISNPTSHGQNHRGKKHRHKLITLTKDTHGKPNEQLFPKQMVIHLH